MKINKTLIIISLLLIFCISLGAVSATDMDINDVNQDNLDVSAMTVDGNNNDNSGDSAITNLNKSKKTFKDLNQTIHQVIKDGNKSITLNNDYKYNSNDKLASGGIYYLEPYDVTIDSSFLGSVSAEIRVLGNESSTEYQNNYIVTQLWNTITNEPVVGETLYYQLLNATMNIRWGFTTDENGKCNISLDYIYSLGTGYIPIANGYVLRITVDSDNIIATGKECNINIVPSESILSREDNFYYIQRLIDNSSDNDQINLNLNYYSTNGFPIIINKNITIRGNNTVLDAKNMSTIFDINKDISVIFEGIIFINGFSNNGKGIICSNCSSLIFRNCSFINNSIELFPYEEYYEEDEEFYSYYAYEDIGIIHAFCEDNFIVTNCSFINNSGRLMNNVDNISKIISAIFVSTKNGSILIDNSSFNNNSGAISLYECDEEYWAQYEETHEYENDMYDYAEDFIKDMSLEKILIKNCLFTSNSNAVYVYSDDWKGFVVIKNCSFNEPENSVVKSDNLIYSYFIIIDNCSFINHKIDANYNDGYGYLGGVVYAHCYAKVTNSLFINNTVTQGYGALLVYSDDGCCEVENSIFINNIAMKGGAIAGYGDCYIDNSLFENNSAIGYEGYIYIDGDPYLVNISGEGGAIFVRSIYVDNSTFINNTAFNGGAICLYINSYDEYEDEYNIASCDISGKITNSIFDGNKVYNKGKNIYIDIIYENCICYDEMPVTFSYNNNLIVDNNFWACNYINQNEFKESNLIVIGYNKYITFMEEYWNPEIEDYDYNYDEFRETNFTDLAPNQWVVLTINYSIPSGLTFNLNLTLNTLNTGSKFNNVLPNYYVSVFSDTGSFNSSSVLISNGVGFVKYTGKSGENNLFMGNFEGDVISSETIEVTLKPTFTIIDDINGYLYDTVTFVAKVASEKVINEGRVVFYVDGVEVGYSKVINGVANYTYTLNKLGNFLIKACYCDGLSYGDSEFVSNLIVNKAIITIAPTTLSTTYDGGKYFQVKVVNVNNKAVSGLKLTLKVYTGSSFSVVTVTTDANGIAKYSVSKLSIATHKVIVSLSNTNYVAESKTSSIKVSKAPTTVTAKKVTYKKGAKKYFKVTIKNKATKKVVKNLVLKIKVYTGKKYKTYKVKTNSKGVAKLSTKALKKGTHKVVISTASKYYTVSKSGKLINIK